MTGLVQVGAVLRKDLLVEWRSPVRLSGLFFFGLALLLMVAFSASATDLLERQAGGMLWLGLLLASTRSFDQSFAAEFEHGAMEGMVLLPVHPAAIFYGKALANAVVLAAVAVALLPLVVGLYDVTIRGETSQLLLGLVLGCAGLAAPGTLLTLITAQARGASVLLPLLLFPTVVPTVLAAARVTTLSMEGDPMGQAPAWLTILAAITLVHWSVAGVLFAVAVEDA